MDRYQRLFGDSDMRSVLAAIMSISVVGIGLGLSGPLLAILMEQDGLSSTLIGTNTAVAGLAAVVAVPFVTMLSVRIGVVNALVLNVLLAAACLLSFYVTDPLPWWFLLRFLFSMALAMIFVLSEFWINTAASEQNRGFILGIYGTVLSLGLTIGPGIITVTGVQGFLPFAIGGIVICCASIPVLIAKSGQPIMDQSEKTPSIVPYMTMVPLATGAVFVFGAVEGAEIALLAVFGIRAGFGEADAAGLLVVLGLGHVCCQIPLGVWSDRVKDRRIILLLCGIVGALGSLLFPVFASSPYLLYITIFFYGGIIGGMYTVGLAHLGSRLTGTDLAQANAAFVMCYAIGMFIGPQFVGISMDLYGTYGFGWGLFVFFAAYLVLYVIRVNSRRSG